MTNDERNKKIAEMNSLVEEICDRLSPDDLEGSKTAEAARNLMATIKQVQEHFNACSV